MANRISTSDSDDAVSLSRRGFLSAALIAPVAAPMIAQASGPYLPGRFVALGRVSGRNILYSDELYSGRWSINDVRRAEGLPPIDDAAVDFTAANISDDDDEAAFARWMPDCVRSAA